MKKILTLVDESFEDLELWYPVYRLREEGCQVDLVAKKPGLYHGKYGVPCQVDPAFLCSSKCPICLPILVLR